MTTRDSIYLPLLMLVGAFVAACGRGDASELDAREAPTPLTVRTARVADTTIARPIVAAGTVAPKDEIALSFKVGGIVQRVAVDPGDVVRAGQTLAVLDMREMDAVLAKARSGAEKAERDLGRARRLHADSVVTLAHLQDAETAAEMARADLAAATFNRRYAAIVAPAAGVVLARGAEPGELAAPGAVVLVLGSRARGNLVRVALADRDALIVRDGDPAVARFEAVPGRTFSGRVTQISAAADPGTGTYTIEITLADASALSAGLVGEVEIRPSRGSPAVLVPIESILEADASGATVYALSADGTRAERRRVEIGHIHGNQVAVTRGLEGVEFVLTDGSSYVDDGASVEVVR